MKALRNDYAQLWVAAGALLSNAEDPKFVITKTAMCGKAQLAALGRVWNKVQPPPEIVRKRRRK